MVFLLLAIIVIQLLSIILTASFLASDFEATREMLKLISDKIVNLEKEIKKER